MVYGIITLITVYPGLQKAGPRLASWVESGSAMVVLRKRGLLKKLTAAYATRREELSRCPEVALEYAMLAARSETLLVKTREG
jgi:hypothetical protein